MIVEEIFKLTCWDFEKLKGLNIQRISFDITKTIYVHKFSDVFVKQEANVLGSVHATIEKME